MDKSTAQEIIHAIKINDNHTLKALGVTVFGNKGRMWSNTACITNLDDIKEQCNPRLSHNHCDVSHAGCPECLKTLEEIATA